MTEQSQNNLIYNISKAFFDAVLERIHVVNFFLKIKGRFYKFRKKNCGIIFAFPKNLLYDSPLLHEELALEEIKQINLLHKNLSDEIAKYKIAVKRVSNNQIPVNHDDAKRLLHKKRAALIIWGDVRSGSIKELQNQVTDIKNINFTYNLRDISFHNGEMLGKFFASSIIGRPRIINHKNDKEDRDRIAINIKNTSCYIVACVLTLNKRYKEAHKVFNQLEEEINNENNDLNIKFLKSVKAIHSFAYFSECRNIGFPAFPSEKTKNKVEALTEKTIITSPYIEEVYINKAIIFFWKREINEAIASLELAPNLTITNFNMAFLHYYNNDIKTGWRYLKKAIKDFGIDQKNEKDIVTLRANRKFIKDIIIFYIQVIKREPDKTLLLFPLSYIIYYIINKKKSTKYSIRLLNNIDKLNILEDEKYILKRKAKGMINGLE